MTTDPFAKIVLVSHGELACALLRAAELIAGPQADVTCLALMPGDGIPALQTRLGEVVGLSRPALVLVDMPGGTPWNVALAVASQNASARVVSGMNLPMLLEVSLSRQGMSIDALARLALESGEEAVQVGPSGA
jgi:mannose/fructose/sorbose-specific phosphotransferase system IIA component